MRQKQRPRRRPTLEGRNSRQRGAPQSERERGVSVHLILGEGPTIGSIKAAGMQAKAAAQYRRETAAAWAATEGAPARHSAAAEHVEVTRRRPRSVGNGNAGASARGEGKLEQKPAASASLAGPWGVLSALKSWFAPARHAAATEHPSNGNAGPSARGEGEMELKLAAGAPLAGPRGVLSALKRGCDPHTPCLLQLQSTARARNVLAARSRRLGSASGGREAAAWAQCGPQLTAASPPPPHVAYVLATSPFVREGGRGQGSLHGEDVLRMHLLALSATAAAISRLLLMVPSESSVSGAWEARVMGNYLDIHAEAARLPFAATLVRMPNNTLGSYGMYLTAYAMWRDQFEYYIFAEDDYVPVRPRFDEELVRMYAQTFEGRPGVLAGLLQGKPAEPTSPWRLHCESAHIMSASSLRHLFRHAYDGGPGGGDGGGERRAAEGGRGGRGHIIEHALSLLAAEGICTTATRAATPHCTQTADGYFDRVQLAFGALLRASNVEARDWTAAYRSPVRPTTSNPCALPFFRLLAFPYIDLRSTSSVLGPLGGCRLERSGARLSRPLGACPRGTRAVGLRNAGARLLHAV